MRTEEEIRKEIEKTAEYMAWCFTEGESEGGKYLVVERHILRWVLGERDHISAFSREIEDQMKTEESHPAPKDALRGVWKYIKDEGVVEKVK